jgi:hypothetical protein
MRKLTVFLILIFLSTPLWMPTRSEAGALKWIRIGKYHTKIVDSGDQGEQSGEGTFAYYYYDKFEYSLIDHAGWQIGTKNWTDEDGVLWPIKISGAGHGSADESINTMPIPDEDGITIRKYMRYSPPTITVDGERVDTPFPLTVADEINPDYISKWGGTADVMVESTIRTSMGLTINQRAFGWSQANHDDYIVFDWTFTNTGNTDLDDEIELPGQVLQDVYFWRANNFRSGYSRPWNSQYGEFPGDSIRMVYAFPQRSSSAEKDDLGDVRSNGWTRRPWAIGEVLLHADTSPSDPTDDVTQPRMTDAYTAEILWAKLHAEATSDADHAKLYDAMQFGFGEPYQKGTYPNTYHGIPLNERGVQFVDEFPWWNWRACSYSSTGPYTLQFGESIRIVWATVCGSMSPEKGWEVGRAWNEGTAANLWEGSYKLPHPYDVFPDLAPTDNDKAKDSWVFSGIDSLFDNAAAAYWNAQHDYQVPLPPPAPNLEVTSLPNKIIVSWGTESEVGDFAGYRVYRAIGSPDTTFQRVFACGAGTDHPQIVNEWEDVNAQRGQEYYYYVTAFDDGSGNAPGVHGISESLESGSYLNRTSRAAILTRQAVENDLSAIRIVPNPYNVSAKELNFTGAPNKISFFDLPPECTIKIYSESGDLIKVIEHTNGAGDDSWGFLAEEHQATDYGQIVVSGVYIAFFETPDGNTAFQKFVIVR